MNFVRNHYIVLLLFFVVVGLFYYNSLQNDFGLDDHYIFENIPKEGTGLSDIFSVFTKRFNQVDYRPVAMITFAIEQYIFGSINPKVSHGINVFLFWLLAITIYSIIIRLPINNAKTIAIITTLIFIAHPIHTNVINNLKSRDGILSMLLMLLSVLSYLKFETTKKKIHLIILVLLALLSINAKKDATNIIFTIPLIGYLFYNRSIKKAIILFVFLFLLTVVNESIIAIIAPMTEGITSNMVAFTENPLPSEAFSLEKISMAITCYFNYIKFMLIPTGYYFYFGYNQVEVHPLFSLSALLQLLAILTPLAIAFLLRKNKLVLFSILFFYACLMYCANIITPVQGIIADRYAFIASLGFCIGVATIIYILSQHPVVVQFMSTFSKKNQSLYIASIVTFFIMLAYFPYVHGRNKDWKDKFTLFDADMPKLEKSYEANRIASTTYINSAMNSESEYERQDYFNKALTYAQQANKVYNDAIFTQESEGMAYYGLGRIAEAEFQFRKVIQQFDTSVVSWDLLGDILFKRNNFDSAALCYANVYRIDKTNEAVYYKYPNTLCKAGKQDSAFAFLKELNKQYPKWYVPYESAAYLYYDYNINYTLGLTNLVRAFELGLQNKDTYNATRNAIIELLENNKNKQQQELESLLRRLNKIKLN